MMVARTVSVAAALLLAGCGGEKDYFESARGADAAALAELEQVVDAAGPMPPAGDEEPAPVGKEPTPVITTVSQDEPSLTQGLDRSHWPVVVFGPPPGVLDGSILGGWPAWEPRPDWEAWGRASPEAQFEYALGMNRLREVGD